MKRILRIALRAIGILAAILLIAGAAAYLRFADVPAIPATADANPALPGQEVLGVRLHVQSFGAPDAPVIIVLHGGPGGDHRSLLPLRALSDRYRVVFYDQRGAGLSERVADAALTLDDHVAELDALAKAHSPDRPVALVGHSWGAILAAAHLGLHPDRVSAAVLIEPGFLDGAGWRAFDARARPLVADQWQTLRGLGALLASGFRALHVTGPDGDARGDYFMGRMVAGFANHPANPYHCPGEAFDSPGWRIGARAMQAVPRQSGPGDMDALAARLVAFPGPVLLMAGACNDWIGAPLQKRHLDLFTKARLVEIPKAGHDVVDDRPVAAIAAIRAFLDPG